MRVRSGIWSVKFGKGTTRYRKSEKQRQRRTMRGEREQPSKSHVSFDHSPYPAPPKPRVYQTTKGNPSPLSSRCHFVFCPPTSPNSPPLSLYIRFAHDRCCSLFHDVFLGGERPRRASNMNSLRGANRWEKFAQWK